MTPPIVVIVINFKRIAFYAGEEFVPKRNARSLMHLRLKRLRNGFKLHSGFSSENWVETYWEL